MPMGESNMSSENAHIITGIHYATGKSIKLSIKNGLIDSMKEYNNSKVKRNIIAPGLVDIQINGYMGIDFNDRSLHANEWEQTIHHLTKVGVTTFYPTVITNSFEQLARIFEENVSYLNNNPFIKQFIGGFHLEGPYISMKDG